VDESDNKYEDELDNKYEDELDKIEEADEVCSLSGSIATYSNISAKEETKSQFTRYSKSSSTVYRNEHLRLLDARFEKVYIPIFKNI
jgi:hypothetical protein